MVDYDLLPRVQSAFNVGTVKEVIGEVIPGVAGFAGAGFIGRQIQNRLGVGDPTVTGLDLTFAKAALANNVPKLIGWAILRGRGVAADTANIGVAINIGFDLLLRFLNKGINPATASLPVIGQVLGESGLPNDTGTAKDVQHLIQENADVRAELAKAYQLLDQYEITPGALPTPEARRRRYGAMNPEDVSKRQRKFGAMSLKTPKEIVMAGWTDSSVPDLTRMFGMR